MSDQERSFDVNQSQKPRLTERVTSAARYCSDLVTWHLFDKPALEAHFRRTMFATPEPAMVQVYDEEVYDEEELGQEEEASSRDWLDGIESQQIPYVDEYPLAEEPLPNLHPLGDGRFVFSLRNPDGTMDVLIDGSTGLIHIDDSGTDLPVNPDELS